MIYTEHEYLAHHGVDKQKWGHRNGPPYPLNPTQMTESQKRANAHESWFKRKKREFEEKKRKAAEEKALHKKGLLTDKDKKDIYDKADIAEAYKHKSEYSNKEISNLLDRYNMQQVLSQKVANLEHKEKQKGIEKLHSMQNVMNAVVGAGSAGINLYNMSAAVSNAFFGTDLKSIKWGDKDKKKGKDKEKDGDDNNKREKYNNKNDNKKQSDVVSSLKTKLFGKEDSKPWGHNSRDDDDESEIGKVIKTIKPSIPDSQIYKPEKDKKDKKTNDYNSISWLSKVPEKDYSQTSRTYVNFNTLADNVKRENSYDFSSFLKKNNIGMSTVNDLTTSHKKEVDAGKDWLYNNDYDKVYEDYYDDDYYKR